jgi:hypothetical protein
MTGTAYKIVFVRFIHLFFCGERKISTAPINPIYPFFLWRKQQFYISSLLLIPFACHPFHNHENLSCLGKLHYVSFSSIKNLRRY